MARKKPSLREQARRTHLKTKRRAESLERKRRRIRGIPERSYTRKKASHTQLEKGLKERGHEPGEGGEAAEQTLGEEIKGTRGGGFGASGRILTGDGQSLVDILDDARRGLSHIERIAEEKREKQKRGR